MFKSPSPYLGDLNPWNCGWISPRLGASPILMFAVSIHFSLKSSSIPTLEDNYDIKLLETSSHRIPRGSKYGNNQYHRALYPDNAPLANYYGILLISPKCPMNTTTIYFRIHWLHIPSFCFKSSASSWPRPLRAASPSGPVVRRSLPGQNFCRASRIISLHIFDYIYNMNYLDRPKMPMIHKKMAFSKS